VFTISTALLKKAGLKKYSPERCTSSGVSVTAFNQEKKHFTQQCLDPHVQVPRPGFHYLNGK
jgi:hypothetical protein